MAPDFKRASAIHAKLRAEQAKQLAEQMRAFLKEHAPFDVRRFEVDPDTPLGVVYHALVLLYGQDLEYVLKESDILSLIDEDPAVYLREDPPEPKERS